MDYPEKWEKESPNEKEFVFEIFRQKKMRKRITISQVEKGIKDFHLDRSIVIDLAITQGLVPQVKDKTTEEERLAGLYY